VENAGYSKTPWSKTGMLLVDKNEAKEKTIKKIARELIQNRSAAVQKD
jgi:signal recognition particle subunit SEC65